VLLELFTANVSTNDSETSENYEYSEVFGRSKINTQVKPGNKPYSQLNKHAYFSRSYADLHARPFPVSKVPLRVSQVCFLHQEDDSQATELLHLHELCHRYSVSPPSTNASCFYQKMGDYEIRWERHTEFSSYTFLVHDSGTEPFACPPIALVPIDWLEGISGELISAVHIDGLTKGSVALERYKLRQYFEGQRLMGSELHNGEAIILSALRLHEDNFNRILLVNASLNECQSGRVLRALLEIEAYRNMALLAFPLAQQVSGKVSKMESQLATLLKQQKDIKSSKDEKGQLAQLSAMSADIAELIASSRYRFDAGSAYYQMVKSRLAELEEKEINELQMISAFIDRRLSPAYRTVLAAKRRLDDLSRRVDRASDFLRTRIDMAIEAQNQALLKSMDNRAQMQFNLQQTVEGISVVVMTYYVLALCKYLLDATSSLGVTFNKPLVITLLMPIVLIGVWIFSRRIKKAIKKTEVKEL
jgi:uncharacterized membrane-anchored protein